MHRIIKNSIIIFSFIIINLTLIAQDSFFSSKSTYEILSNTDDAEESEFGVMSLESSDLELVYEDTKQVVGLRFTNIKLPRNIKISKAYLQFTVDEITSGSCNLNISGELTDNAKSFKSSNYNISSRTVTVNIVNWQPQPWNIKNESGEAQKSSDISQVIQEIINFLII